MAPVATNRDANGPEEFLVLREESNESSHGGSGITTPKKSKIIIINQSNTREQEAKIDKIEQKGTAKKAINFTDKTANNKSMSQMSHREPRSPAKFNNLRVKTTK